MDLSFCGIRLVQWLRITRGTVLRKSSFHLILNVKSRVHIGISGWTYGPWRGGPFYPEGWPHHRELEYASRKVNSIEINGSFYSLQLPSSYRAWYEATPERFVFSVKGGRFITHAK